MSLLGLAAAYDSDSDSNNSEEESDVKVEVKKEEAKPKAEPVREVLANPFLTTKTVVNVKPSFMQETEKISGVKFDNSVFQNPFRAKEDQKMAVLEQHVAMSQKDQTGRTIDGKKVCWMFRKGRCRNGHKCKFAHDNDIKNAVTEKLYTETKTYEEGSQISNDKARKGAVAPLPMEKAIGIPKADQQPQQSFEHISSAGQNLMAKMGWEAGKGLGSRGTGIVNAIQVSFGGHGQGKIQGPDTGARGGGVDEEEQLPRKKRPGVSDSLTLGKKAKAFHDKVYKH